MNRASNGDYVRTGDGVVTRGCEHCDWFTVAGGYATMVEHYQDHLREEHHRAWIRA